LFLHRHAKSFSGQVLLLIVLLPVSLFAQEISREEAESRLEALKSEISVIQQSLAQSRKRFAGEQQQLREIDLDIQAGALRIRDLQEQRQALEKELRQLEADRTDYLESLGESKALLGKQMVSAYQLGRESRLKLLLNQDSPAKLSRMLAYYDYFSRAQVDQIQELRIALDTLDRLQAGIDSRLLALDDLRQQREKEQESLQGRRDQRQQMLDSLAGQINSNEARLIELSRNREDLESLLERLSGALADIPSELGQYISALEQRGSIPMPIRGRVMHSFGQDRMGGLKWQGWLIEAEGGTDVLAIAYGRVAYADWLRGYGLLMIIDHGDGIMSLYGHNESLLFDVGDWVQPGAVISTVGSSAGNSQGLYFELRNNGKAVDPATWLSR
jgi:septal ring factor EnvC (AmiA/AmiB activator)